MNTSTPVGGVGLQAAGADCLEPCQAARTDSGGMQAVGPANVPSEFACAFSCEGDTLVGLLHRPADPMARAAETGVVIVVGGPQYRAGSHRQFVHLARHLAQAGHPVLRFDTRGMGDSSGHQRSFEHMNADIGAAIHALQQQQPRVRQVVLWGLCDGASAALLYLQEHADPRVKGLCLVNPWVRSAASLARTHVKHYYRQRLMQREFWAKLFSGQIAGQALRALLSNLQTALSPAATAPASAAPFQSRMAQAWMDFKGPLLLVLSGRDYTAREFIETTLQNAAWHHALSRPNVQRHDADTADHTFSSHTERDGLERITSDWLRHGF